MSRILGNKKRVLGYLLGLLIVLLILLWLRTEYVVALLVVGIYLLIAAVNEMTRSKMKRESFPFSTQSSVRNVDFLVIGDYCNVREFIPEGSTVVRICAPGRGYCSSWQLLRHTHSILKENGGTVIMAIGKSKKNFLLFDIPFLHTITIKKYHLEGLCKRSKMPFYFAPFDSLNFLLGGG